MPDFEIVRKRLNALANTIHKDIFPGFGFMLVIFEFERLGVSNYISNANRKDMIKTLRETADRLESHSDWQSGQEN